MCRLGGTHDGHLSYHLKPVARAGKHTGSLGITAPLPPGAATEEMHLYWLPHRVKGCQARAPAARPVTDLQFSVPLSVL